MLRDPRTQQAALGLPAISPASTASACSSIQVRTCSTSKRPSAIVSNDGSSRLRPSISYAPCARLQVGLAPRKPALPMLAERRLDVAHLAALHLLGEAALASRHNKTQHLRGFSAFLNAGRWMSCKPSGFASTVCTTIKWCARVDSNHHGPYGPQGPQPCASTNSATGAEGASIAWRCSPPADLRRTPAAAGRLVNRRSPEAGSAAPAAGRRYPVPRARAERGGRRRGACIRPRGSLLYEHMFVSPRDPHSQEAPIWI
jgi:hypothetical protein